MYSNQAQRAKLSSSKDANCYEILRFQPNILVKIFECLLDDPISYRSLMMTCKYFNFIATTDIIDRSPEKWARARPLKFFFHEGLPVPRIYTTLPCSSHRACAGHPDRPQIKCEVHLADMKPWTREENCRNLNAWHFCYYHRLLCLTRARYITFSSIKYTERYLLDNKCLEGLDGAYELKMRALVEVEIGSCAMMLDWLDALLAKLTHVQYITLDNITWTRREQDGAEQHPALVSSRVVKSLRIINDWGHQLKDNIFIYFVEHIAAQELDMTNTPVQEALVFDNVSCPRPREQYRQITLEKRPEQEHLTNPHSQTLSFEMVLIYLRRHRNVVRQFVAKEMGLKVGDVESLFRDESLKHLHVHLSTLPYETTGKMLQEAWVPQGEFHRIHYNPDECLGSNERQSDETMMEW